MKNDNASSYYDYVSWRDQKLRPLELEYNQARTRLEAAQRAEREAMDEAVRAWNRYYEERKRLSIDEYRKELEGEL